MATPRLAIGLSILALACAANPHSTSDAPCAATSRLSDSTVYDTAQVQSKPQVLSGSPIRYPDRARLAGVQGRVLLALIISPRGQAERSSIRVVNSLDRDLDKAAMDYVRTATFRPGCRDGRAVRVSMRLPIDFRIFR